MHKACFRKSTCGARVAQTLAVALVSMLAGHANSAPVVLQNATATLSQSGFPVSTAIDGVSTPGAFNGWAIDPNAAATPPQATAQTAVFETSSNLFAAGGTLTFVLDQVFGGQHTIGRFRLSATTDDRSLFADGLQSGGDVSASWTILDPLTFVSSAGATMAEQGDNSILVSGLNPATDIYTITASTALSGITGFRLELLEDASLPDSGPGRQPSNGNLVLSELRVDAVAAVAAVPEPAMLGLLGIGFAALGFSRRHRS
jgi:hypothetical protein